MGSRAKYGLDNYTAVDKYAVVFDLDGVLVKYQYVQPMDRGPETAPQIYGAMEPTNIIDWPKVLARKNNIQVLYLTTRPKAAEDATVKWMIDRGMPGDVLFTETLQNKVGVLDDWIPTTYNVHPKNIWAFDDRWEELLQSEVIRKTHLFYPNKIKKPIIKRNALPDYVHRNRGGLTGAAAIYQEYPEFVNYVLRRAWICKESLWTWINRNPQTRLKDGMFL